jgi:hypothetical protein
MKKRLLYFLFLSAALVVSCRQQVDPPEFGFEYFGLEEGKFVRYEVTEIFHDAAVNVNDTNKYILKTLVGEPIIDNEGREANKVFRFSYDIETEELIDQRVWTGIIADSRGELVEENQRIIRLVFAITAAKTWNIHAFNTMEEERAEYNDLHLPKNIAGNQLDSTVTVKYEDFFSLVDYIVKYDIYAKHIGLVQRSYKDLTIQNFDTLNITKGTEIHYRLLDWGEE